MSGRDRYGGPVDEDRYGPYRIRRDPGDTRPLYRIDGRITADGTSGFAAEPGRYHIYSGWFCPWAQRVTIVHALLGLEDVVSVSYVDGRRDARGWAFRESYGPDPVNGFRFLREAYEVTEPGFDGHVSVPTLWDRQTGQVVSNNYDHVGIDLATQFGAWSTTGYQPYPAGQRDEIEELDRWIGPAVNRGVYAAGGSGPAADAARDTMDAALADLDERLVRRRYLLGDAITEADVRLFVTLVRWAGDLERHPNLWAYARDLYAHPAFSSTTDFSTFRTSVPAGRDWTAPSGRAELAAGVG